ncbi:MAG: helix-turn-helix transcriptional regulator [Thermoanaerobaculales bacterium]|jgi:DNA-binding HxlR family transcriptional regulator|nr:helix-turn-helix transcriptional regulator [Thermoanaerobaculales bacterium]
MKGYGQFCPVAKASEVLAERWTPLVLRELLCGSRRFNDIHRGVPLMSRSLLATRLRELERAGVLVRRTASGLRNQEYALTAAGEELLPIIEGLGRWGQRWVVADVAEDDLDPSLLMWDIRRNLRSDELPEQRVVTQFDFLDVTGPRRTWWLLAARDGGDICMTDPGFAVDLIVTVRLHALTRYWLGQIGWRDVVGSAEFRLEGPPWARRSLPRWLGRSGFAEVARP